jgi:hypothetical protein
MLIRHDRERFMKLDKTLVALALGLMVVSNAKAADTSVFAGISAAKHSAFGYVGAVKSMNSDLSQNGMLLRALVYYGDYEYDTTAVAQGKVDGTGTGAELGVGYQWVNPSNRISIYGSVDHQDHRLSPNDTHNSVRGAETGAAVQFEAETLGTPWYGGFIGKSSSANDSYWVRGRLGYVFGRMTLGPEGIAAGNQEYHENRLGLFVNIAMSKSTTVSVSAGGRRAEGHNALNLEKGGYGGMSISTSF